jgi:hypothetical protein
MLILWEAWDAADFALARPVGPAPIIAIFLI